MADRYIVIATGGCLGPAVPDGTRLVADPSAEIKPLSLVSVTLRRTGGPWDKFLQSEWIAAMGFGEYPADGLGKIFLDRVVRAGREVLLLGQFNPPCIGVVPVDEIEAAHKIVRMENGSREAWLSVKEEFNLIAWARGENTIQPINPEWRPPSPEQQALRAAVRGFLDATKEMEELHDASREGSLQPLRNVIH
jgi:hypothetical protein